MQMLPEEWLLALIMTFTMLFEFKWGKSTASNVSETFQCISSISFNTNNEVRDPSTGRH